MDTTGHGRRKSELGAGGSSAGELSKKKACEIWLLAGLEGGGGGERAQGASKARTEHCDSTPRGKGRELGEGEPRELREKEAPWRSCLPERPARWRRPEGRRRGWDKYQRNLRA